MNFQTKKVIRRLVVKDKIKNISIKLFKYVLVFIILICVYMLLLTISSMIPSTLLQENVKQSSEILALDGEKKQINLLYKKEYIFTFTDALMINTAYSIDNTTPLKSPLLARKNYIPGQTKVEHVDSQYNLGATSKYKNSKTGDIYQVGELYGLMHGEQIEDSFEYARYWHGYLVLLRPLLAIFNYSAIRVLFLVITLALIAILSILIYKKIDLQTAIIYILGFISISIWIVTRSINESLIFIFTLICMVFILFRKNKIKDSFIFFFIIGSIINFIDLLTAPIVSLGLVGTTYFLILQKENDEMSTKHILKEIIKICLAWALGYGLTWAIKWIIVQLLYNRNLIIQAIEQAKFRILIPKQYKFTIFDVLIKNALYLSFNTIISILGFMVGYILYELVKNKNKEVNFKNNLRRSIPFIFLSLLPIAWYIVLKQHSLIHSFFTYRIMIVTIINIFIIIKTLFKTEKQ